MNPLLELADRVEAATGMNRELDFAIQRTVRDKPMLVFGMDACPTYTSSLDAAMTLVPEGWTLVLAVYHDAATATLEDDRVHPVRLDTVDGEAATPALALTAASLRAIASMGSSG